MPVNLASVGWGMDLGPCKWQWVLGRFEKEGIAYHSFEGDKTPSRSYDANDVLRISCFGLKADLAFLTLVSLLSLFRAAIATISFPKVESFCLIPLGVLT
jgi:hypothetical protein